MENQPGILIFRMGGGLLEGGLFGTAVIPGAITALPWEPVNGVGIRGDPQSAPADRILRFPSKSYGFHQTLIKPC